jgi:hypothetical protein
MEGSAATGDAHPWASTKVALNCCTLEVRKEEKEPELLIPSAISRRSIIATERHRVPTLLIADYTIFVNYSTDGLDSGIHKWAY